MYHLHRYWRCTSSELDGVSIIVILYPSNKLWHGTLAPYCYKSDVKTFCTDISDKQTFTCTIRLELCRLPYKARKSKQEIPMLLRINFSRLKPKRISNHVLIRNIWNSFTSKLSFQADYKYYWDMMSKSNFAN